MPSNGNSTPILETRNLKVYFPVFGGVFQRKVAEVKAVDGVDLEVRPRETLGLVGESGCGKTTVGRAMINVLRHVSPDVSIQGDILYRFSSVNEPINVARLHPRRMRGLRSKIQMIFQDPYASLNPRMSVSQIIGEPLTIHRKDLNSTQVEEKVQWLLEKVGMQPEQAQRYPHEFSGGQRQRIGIARAIATNPEVVICDEPVSALDVSIQAQVINLMLDLQEEFSLSYVLIAHDLSVVEHISNRIAVMYLGNIVEIGPAKEVYWNGLHPYTQALLSAVPLPDPRKTLKRKRFILEGDVPTPLNKPSGCGFRTRCPLAEPACAEQVPPLTDVGGDRKVACIRLDAAAKMREAGPPQ